MYAQLGDIIFSPLNSFEGYSEDDPAVIARYALLQGKPLAVTTAPDLREISIGLRLHQRFIVVKNARAQLRAYKDNGTIVTLTWGNGNIEGKFLIERITTNIEEQDGLGNIFAVVITLNLTEVADGNTLSIKQQDAQKAAFGISNNATPVVAVKKNPVKPKSQFVQWATKASKYASVIDDLSYGGSVPSINGSLASSIANTGASLTQMQSLFNANQDDLGLPDSVGTQISSAISSCNAMGALVPITDIVAFNTAHNTFQTNMAQLAVGTFECMGQVITRVDGLRIH